MKKVFLAPSALVLLLGLTTCKKELIPGNYYGTPAPMGNGTIQSFSTFDGEGKPVAIGMVLTDAALDNLPNDPDGNHHTNVFEAQLPPEIVSKTPFVHVAANWNSLGHTTGLYDKPHFDFHFYMITSAERNTIPTYTNASAQFDNFPPAGYLHADFISPPAPEAREPKMGLHWIDKTAPELPPNGGAPFEETWIYGSYNGKVTFYEPMMTLVFFKNITNFTKNIKRNDKVHKSGYYPTLLHVTHADGKYTISLEKFEYRKAE